MTGEASAIERSADEGAAQCLRIVIADDEPDTVLTLAAILQEEGYEVYGFGSGREAVAAARMYKADVLIVDIQMPDMTGYAIARQVRETLHDLPLLIAISGRWKSETDMLLSVAVGFDNHFKKPCDPAALVACIRNWASARQRRFGPQTA
jgi:DNA-binding response OmpR family regulator